MKVTIAKWGNSNAVRLPKALIEAPGFEEGAQLELTVERRISPATGAAGEDRLKDLLAEMDGAAGIRTGSVDWGPDRGSEIIKDDFPRWK